MIPTQPIDFWQYFDFISIGALGILIAYLLVQHKNKHGSLLKTISQTVAYTPRSSLAFSLGMSVFFPTYYAFLYFWLGPLVKAPSIFYVLLIVSAISELIFVWVPALSGIRNKIHQIASGIVGFMMLALPILVLTSATQLSSTGKIVIWAYVIISALMLASLVFSRLRSCTFQYEVLYCIVFLITMSVVAHG